jgi:regulator of CtrA degradation
MTDQFSNPAASSRAEVVRDFARSELFERTFQDGMELVEDAAAYLDGPGRQESKLLSRNAALAYAGESMRLTTRLMKLASWLLVQRAVREGDMAAADACDARYRLTDDDERLTDDLPKPTIGIDPLLCELPTGILDLAERSSRLYDRARHLDKRMYVEPTDSDAPHPVLSQFDRLRQAYGDS